MSTAETGAFVECLTELHQALNMGDKWVRPAEPRVMWAQLLEEVARLSSLQRSLELLLVEHGIETP
jgi:hypothetical protein